VVEGGQAKAKLRGLLQYFGRHLVDRSDRWTIRLTPNHGRSALAKIHWKSVFGTEWSLKSHRPNSPPKPDQVTLGLLPLRLKKAPRALGAPRVELAPSPPNAPAQSLPRSSIVSSESSERLRAALPVETEKDANASTDDLGFNLEDLGDPASSSDLTQYTNPKISARIELGVKQYLFAGKPVFPAYEHGGPKGPRREIGRGTEHLVETRRNPNSTVLRKVPHSASPDSDHASLMLKAQLMNDVAEVLLGDDGEAGRMAPHFAIELMRKIWNGQPVFYTRKVDGFTLETYLSKPADHPELPFGSLGAKGKELLAAIDWMRAKGYFHEDLNPANVMFDRTSGKLLLIDMESFARVDPIEDKSRCDAYAQVLRERLGI